MIELVVCVFFMVLVDVCPQIFPELSNIDKFTWSVRLELAPWEV